VVAAAVEIATRFDSTIIPFRAIQIPAEFPAAAHTNYADPLPVHLEHEAVQEIQRFFEGLDVKREAPVVGQGQPWRAILAAAERHDVDLIVIGSHSYHGIDRILGTTAGKVANLASRNVLVVHNRVSSHDSAAFVTGEADRAAP
jgi:nucleotide-binding universal stress UspA family protein